MEVLVGMGVSSKMCLGRVHRLEMPTMFDEKDLHNRSVALAYTLDIPKLEIENSVLCP